MLIANLTSEQLTKIQVDLWDAINEYVVACGGRPDARVYGNSRRQLAVVEVERVVSDALMSTRDEIDTERTRP